MQFKVLVQLVSLVALASATAIIPRQDSESPLVPVGGKPDPNHRALLRYMNLSEHLVSTFNFAILHSLDTHFVYLLAIKSMPITINPSPTQPNPTQSQSQSQSQAHSSFPQPPHFL
ncbi:hypothetical protein B0H13DRAFT_1915421 [Mycena leptocephala]|nr:hypothetical protein B0H13DRAFT_1915421 [Mycena leptocephala]